MKVSVIGVGYVGLVSGACFAEFGHDVTCVDLDADKIADLQNGKIPIYEPGLDDLVAKNVRAGNLRFTTDLAPSVAVSDVVFIAVGTPSRRGDGHADLTFVYAAAEEIAAALNGYTVLVTKSTVPVGTGTEIDRIVGQHIDDCDYDVASNPEFLREGAAIEDFMRPNRVVVGTESERAKSVLRELYRPLYLNETPILFTGRETAELIKYASNAFLATKISFINEIADLCETVGADVQQVAKGMGLDQRIGAKFLHPGPGYGGSCFPKDTLALLRIAEEQGVDLDIIASAVGVNETRKSAMAGRIIRACGGSVDGKNIAVLGLTFKPNTDDMRESPSLTIIPALIEAGATVRGCDPAGLEAAKALMPDFVPCDDAYEAMKDADGLVIITEWNQYRALDMARVKSTMRNAVIVDLRNIYDPAEFVGSGITYSGLGRG